MKIEPVLLTGTRVELEPLSYAHVRPLAAFGLDEGLWRWTVNSLTKEPEMRDYVSSALQDAEKGATLPFVTKVREGDKIVGSTRFSNIDVRNRRAEIGWTWIDADWQRTFVNSEAKLLMLTHAFEAWGCVRVELKTDALNETSRAAILRLGAKEEGIFRKHMITDSGRFRDTVYFSIIDSEWGEVKAALVERLGRSE